MLRRSIKWSLFGNAAVQALGVACVQMLGSLWLSPSSICLLMHSRCLAFTMILGQPWKAHTEHTTQGLE